MVSNKIMLLGKNDPFVLSLDILNLGRIEKCADREKYKFGIGQ